MCRDADGMCLDAHEISPEADGMLLDGIGMKKEVANFAESLCDMLRWVTYL